MAIDQWIKASQKRNPKLVKPEDVEANIYKRIGRSFSIPIAKFVHRYIPITPNQITALVTLICVIIAYLFSLGQTRYTILAGILFLINLQLDFVDGTLARLKGTASTFGGWLDHISDEFGKIIIYLGIMWGLWKNNPVVWVWIFGFLSLTSYLMGSLLYLYFYKLFPFANTIVEEEKTKRNLMKQFFFIDPFITVVISVFAIFNHMYAYIIVTAFYGWLFVVGAFTMMSLKAYRALPIKK